MYVNHTNCIIGMKDSDNEDEDDEDSEGKAANGDGHEKMDLHFEHEDWDRDEEEQKYTNGDSINQTNKFGIFIVNNNRIQNLNPSDMNKIINFPGMKCFLLVFCFDNFMHITCQCPFVNYRSFGKTIPGNSMDSQISSNILQRNSCS